MVYLIPLALGYIGYNSFDGKRDKSMLWYVIFLYLTLLIGLRYKVGGDTYNYMAFYEYCPNIKAWSLISSTMFEPGFTFLSACIKSFTDNIYVFQTIIIILFNILLFTFIKKHTQYKYLCFLFVYIANYMYFATEILRESLAVGIFIHAYSEYLNGHRFKYYTMITLAMLFHFGAAFCYLIPLFSRLKFNSNLLVLVFFAFFGLFLIHPILNSLSHIYIFSKILRYSEHGYVGYLWVMLRILYFAILPSIILYICKFKYNIKFKYESLICLQILLSLGLFFVPILFQRLINYTIIPYLVALSEGLGILLTKKQNISLYAKKARAIMASFFVILTIAFHSTYYVHLDFYQCWYPYHSMFDPVEVYSRSRFIAGQE
jgi:hypothetical protein